MDWQTLLGPACAAEHVRLTYMMECVGELKMARQVPLAAHHLLFFLNATIRGRDSTFCRKTQWFADVTGFFVGKHNGSRT